MHYFNYKQGALWVEDIRVSDLVKAYGSPLYVYSKKTLKRHFKAFDSAFVELDHLICYSVKANSNLSILKHLAQWGAGADIVSGGELFRALKAGVDHRKIVYSGVGKKDDEIRYALDADILMFNVESLQELKRIEQLARQSGKIARVSLRLNPDVDPQTHPYISTGLKENKFGLSSKAALAAYVLAKDSTSLEAIGIDCHIGSQLTLMGPFLEALDKILAFSDELKIMGLPIKFLDLGGGLGITYDKETPPHPVEFGRRLSKSLKGRELTLILEPGRVIAGNAGILVTKVLYTKKTDDKNFIIVDAAMNDLVRPSLYGSFHHIAEVNPKGREEMSVDVVGPICESTDFLARDRALPAVESGELLSIFSAGAYCFTMSSQYNSRPRAAELIVDGSQVKIARKRETYEDIIALEL
jgi:diaminopimelate decarboxylase